MRSALRITDRANGTTVDRPGTVQDLDVPVDAACTVDAGSGDRLHLRRGHHASTRSFPASSSEGARAVWEVGQVEVLDGGPDGDPDTPGNGVFARQGVFVP